MKDIDEIYSLAAELTTSLKEMIGCVAFCCCGSDTIAHSTDSQLIGLSHSGSKKIFAGEVVDVVSPEGESAIGENYCHGVLYHDTCPVVIGCVGNVDEIKLAVKVAVLGFQKKILAEGDESIYEQVRKLERFAGIGRMVAGITHEVNTPVGITLSYITMQQDRLEKLLSDYKQGLFKKSTFENFCSQLEESLDLSVASLIRVADLIKSFKQVAVDQSSNSTRTFELNEYLQTSLLSLSPVFKGHSHEIEIAKTDDELMVTSKAGAIMQILTNLIMNSLIHGFENMENGLMSISVSLGDDGIVTVDYRDNGNGLTDEVRSKLFEEFYTTKINSGGSGIGMFLSRDLARNELGGDLICNGDTEEGANFILTFPQKN